MSRKGKAPLVEYEFTWRNKWLTSDAKSIDDMIATLRGAADDLQRMKERGVTLRDDGGVGDDYATLVTTDAEVAAEFGFEVMPVDEE